MTGGNVFPLVCLICREGFPSFSIVFRKATMFVKPTLKRKTRDHCLESPSSTVVIDAVRGPWVIWAVRDSECLPKALQPFVDFLLCRTDGDKLRIEIYNDDDMHTHVYRFHEQSTPTCISDDPTEEKTSSFDDDDDYDYGDTIKTKEKVVTFNMFVLRLDINSYVVGFNPKGDWSMKESLVDSYCAGLVGLSTYFEVSVNPIRILDSSSSKRRSVLDQDGFDAIVLTEPPRHSNRNLVYSYAKWQELLHSELESDESFLC